MYCLEIPGIPSYSYSTPNFFTKYNEKFFSLNTYYVPWHSSMYTKVVCDMVLDFKEFIIYWEMRQHVNKFRKNEIQTLWYCQRIGGSKEDEVSGLNLNLKGWVGFR